MTTPFLPGIIVRPARNDDRVGVAKRARDEDPLPLLEEAAALGYSSSVPERSVALRRRLDHSDRSPPKGCGWVAATAAATTAEHCCRREEAAAEAEDKKKVMADDLLSLRDSPIATPLRALCSFIAEVVSEAWNDTGCWAAGPAPDVDGHPDPYVLAVLSNFCLTQ